MNALFEAALQGWLAAAVGWTAISLGCLVVVLMRVLVGAGLEHGYGPALAAGGRTLPLAGLAFLPVLIWLPHLFPWATVGPEGGLRRWWLHEGFFVARTIGYFVLWSVLAVRVRGRAGSVAGLALVAVTGSMAGLDWVLSLQPAFHSSIWGMLFLAHASLAGWSLAVAATLAGDEPALPQVAAGYLIGGIALWAYLSFCQYLVVWNANQAPEIGWYLARQAGGWGLVLWAASLLEGVVPLLLLMPARVRASRAGVAGVAAMVVIGGLVEAAVMVLPPLGAGPGGGLAAVVAMVALGGCWLAVFAHA